MFPDWNWVSDPKHRLPFSKGSLWELPLEGAEIMIYHLIKMNHWAFRSKEIKPLTSKHFSFLAWWSRLAIPGSKTGKTNVSKYSLGEPKTNKKIPTKNPKLLSRSQASIQQQQKFPIWGAVKKEILFIAKELNCDTQYSCENSMAVRWPWG